MYKKCESCYKDGKTPNEESCKKCEDELKRKEQEYERLKKQNEIMLKNLKKLQNKLCSSTSQCKYFLIDVLKEVENVQI